MTGFICDLLFSKMTCAVSIEHKGFPRMNLRKAFIFNGAPPQNRTVNLMIKSHLLCLIELAALNYLSVDYKIIY